MCERTGGWRASWKPVQSSPSCCACPSAFFLLQAKSTSFRATSVTVENMEKNDTEEKNIIPDYVCCVLSEGTWTWFGAILVSLLLLLIAILKYCRKYLSKPKFESKNLTLLRKSLIGNWQLYFTSSKQGRPPRKSEKGAVRCCRRAMRGYNSGLCYGEFTTAAFLAHFWTFLYMRFPVSLFPSA